MSSATTCYVVPRPPEHPFPAMRWESRDQWKDLVRFAGNPVEDPDDDPPFMYDSDGREYSVGCWLVRVDTHVTKAFTDDEFRRLFMEVAPPHDGGGQ